LLNTVVAADNIIVKQDGNKLFETGCVGTLNLGSGRIDDPIQGLVWYCDGGVCGTDFSYAGSSTSLTVEIDPNCAGTSDTLWGFWLACPW
jgi:hypothetical protein